MKHLAAISLLLSTPAAAEVVSADAHGFEVRESVQTSVPPAVAWATFVRIGQWWSVEHSYSGDSTNWWIPNRACLGAMLRSAGFHILAHAEEEVYVCRTGPRPHGDAPLLIGSGASTKPRQTSPRAR